jgi:RHS repeat-associated protein
VTGYAANGNIVAYSDSVNGYWNLGYDALSRLTSSAQGQVNGGFNSYGCWSYDSFGNRTEQATSNQAIQPYGCQPASGASSFYATTMQFTDGTNRITGRGTITPSGTQSVAAPGYDSAGNLIRDQSYGYVYDGQGQMCAAHTAQGMVGYIYDAEGNRVAKGTITAMNCDPTANGFALTTLYELGPNGQPMTEVDNGAWSHTDVYAGGLQVATYDGNGVHFQLHDWLGTRRVQTNYAGVVEDACSSNPYGDGQTCSNAVMDTSDQHFTGKERDQESGLDYFGARYYASTMGRFSSPDPSGLYFANPYNPQSLNLYSYVLNNPMINVDPDGLRCVWDDGSFDAEDDPDTAAVDKSGGHSNCTNQGGTWYDKGQYSPGVDWASTNQDGTLTLHVNASPFQPGYTTNQGGQPSAAAAALDLTSSTAVGLISDIFTGRLNIFAPTAQDPHDDSHRLFDTVNCGPGGNGSMDGLMNSRCAIHDACFDSAHLSAANNAAGGPGMTQSQKDAATACNQALYNAARANPTRAGASALQWWLVKGANPPFGGSLIAPGTEAKPW